MDTATARTILGPIAAELRALRKAQPRRLRVWMRRHVPDLRQVTITYKDGVIDRFDDLYPVIEILTLWDRPWRPWGEWQESIRGRCYTRTDYSLNGYLLHARLVRREPGSPTLVPPDLELRAPDADPIKHIVKHTFKRCKAIQESIFEHNNVNRPRAGTTA